MKIRNAAFGFAHLGAAMGMAAEATAGAASPTFHRNVEALLQSHRQSCHRPGGIGPISLRADPSSPPWAKAIQEAVLKWQMPPWLADPHYGHFSNDRSLAKEQIGAIVDLVDRGAMKGDTKDAPPPKHWLEGWNISAPGVVISMPHPFEVSATGEPDYQYVVLPTGFTEDRSVQRAEVRATVPAVVHHVVGFVRPPTSNWVLGESQPGVAYVPRNKNPDGSRRSDINANNLANDLLTICTPAMVPGVGKRIPAGSGLVPQIHYTPNGKPAADPPKGGFGFAKALPAHRALTLIPANVGLRIPPGDRNCGAGTRIGFSNGATLSSFFPHMHLRGKAFEYRAVYPDGDSMLLFHPAAEVRWGQQTQQEIMVGSVDVGIPAEMTPRKFLAGRRTKGN